MTELFDAAAAGALNDLLDFSTIQQDVDMEGSNGENSKTSFSAFLPMLSRLHEQSNTTSPSPHSSLAQFSKLSAALLPHKSSNSYRSYARLIKSLEPTSIYQYLEEYRYKLSSDADTMAHLAHFRTFENGDSSKQVYTILEALYAFQFTELRSEVTTKELFNNPIYSDSIGAILVNLLGHLDHHKASLDGLECLSIEHILDFCFYVPQGASYCHMLITSDPSLQGKILDQLLRHLDQPLGTHDPSGVWLKKAYLNALLFLLHSSALSAFTAMQNQRRLLERLETQPEVVKANSITSGGLIVSLLLSMSLETSSLQTSLPTCICRLLKHESCVSALQNFLQLSTSYESLSPFMSKVENQIRQERLQTVLSSISSHVRVQIEAQLISQLHTSSSNVTITRTLQSLLAFNLLHDPQVDSIASSSLSLLQALDTLSKRSLDRCTPLAFLLLLLTCSQYAPVLSQSNVQDANRSSFVQSAQTCLQSMTSHSSHTFGALIVGAVWLYTKSRRLPEWITQLLDAPGISISKCASLKADYCYYIADVLFKPVFTEAFMAEKLVSSSFMHIEWRDHALLELLRQHSFVRHPHLSHPLEALISKDVLGRKEVSTSSVAVVNEFIENYIISFEYVAQETGLAIIPVASHTVRRLLRSKELTCAALTLLYAMKLNARVKAVAMHQPSSKLATFLKHRQDVPKHVDNVMVRAYDLDETQVASLLTTIHQDTSLQEISSTLQDLSKQLFPSVQVDTTSFTAQGLNLRRQELFHSRDVVRALDESRFMTRTDAVAVFISSLRQTLGSCLSSDAYATSVQVSIRNKYFGEAVKSSPKLRSIQHTLVYIFTQSPRRLDMKKAKRQYLSYTTEPFAFVQDVQECVWHSSLVDIVMDLCHLFVQEFREKLQVQEARARDASSEQTQQLEQLYIVQTCLILHGLFERMSTLLSSSLRQQAQDERVMSICNGLNKILLADEKVETQVLSLLHTQTYDRPLVPILSAYVPQMRELLTHWATPEKNPRLLTLLPPAGKPSTSVSVKWRFQLHAFIHLLTTYPDDVHTNGSLAALMGGLQQVKADCQNSLLSSSVHAQDRMAFCDFFEELVSVLAELGKVCDSEMRAEVVTWLGKMKRVLNNSSDTRKKGREEKWERVGQIESLVATAVEAMT